MIRIDRCFHISLIRLNNIELLLHRTDQGDRSLGKWDKGDRSLGKCMKPLLRISFTPYLVTDNIVNLPFIITLGETAVYLYI